MKSHNESSPPRYLPSVSLLKAVYGSSGTHLKTLNVLRARLLFDAQQFAGIIQGMSEDLKARYKDRDRLKIYYIERL